MLFEPLRVTDVIVEDGYILDCQPDVIIRPDVADIGVLDRVDVTAIADLGEQAAREMLPELRKATAWTERLRRMASRLTS